MLFFVIIKIGGEVIKEVFRNLIASFSFGVAIIDEKGSLLYRNTKADEILRNYINNEKLENKTLSRIKELAYSNRVKKSIDIEEDLVIILNCVEENPVTMFSLTVYSKKESYLSKDLMKYSNNIELLDYTSDAIFIDDDNGNTVFVNRACEEIYDIDKREVIGKNISYLEDERIFYPSVAKLVYKDKKQVSILHSNKNGKQLLTTGAPILDDMGNIKNVVSTSRDITELITLRNKLEDAQYQLEEFKELKKDVDEYDDFIVRSKKMGKVIQLGRKLSQIDSTVLITGESGVGKGKVAKYIHKLGIRKNKPFVKVNCGAIPETLIESELFGYEAGSFTGSSKKGKMGLFELAQSGTIFLDEIGELPLNLQVKILQAIQDKEIQRVGGVKTINIDVRIIAATNRDLKKMVEEGKFREDLYYRLNVVPIHIPPLRTRQEDIIPLSRHFLKKYNEKFNLKKRMDPNTISSLMQYSWPGNVRELENIVERVVITSSHNTITPDVLPEQLFEVESEDFIIKVSKDKGIKSILEDVERQVLSDAIQKYKTTRALATFFDTSQPTIVRKLNKYKIKYENELSIG